MKKILILLFVLLLLPFNISAENKHLNIDANNSLDTNKLNAIEEDLNQLQQQYDYNFQYYYLPYLSDEEIADYGDQLVNDLPNSHNVIMIETNTKLYLAFKTKYSEELISQREQFYNNYLDQNLDFYDAIIKTYQDIFKICNQDYIPEAPIYENVKRLNDEADLLTIEQETIIQDKLDQFSQTNNMDLVIYISNDQTISNPQTYTDDYLDFNDFNQNAICLMINLNTRDWYVSTKGRLMNLINDYDIDNIMEEPLDYLSNNEIYEALNSYSDNLISQINYAINANTNYDDIYNDNNYNQPVKTFDINNVYISLAIGAVVATILALIFRNQLKSVAPNRYARNYIQEGSFHLTGYSNIFINKHITKHLRPKDNGGSSSGGSSFHTSGGGSSHGGHGGKF